MTKYLDCGPHVYELFSVLVHQGGAFGGHYYAYIKSFSDNKWYCFDDSNVTEVDKEKVMQTYGGNGGSANAYMLFYRLYQKD